MENEGVKIRGKGSNEIDRYRYTLYILYQRFAY